MKVVMNMSGINTLIDSILNDPKPVEQFNPNKYPFIYAAEFTQQHSRKMDFDLSMNSTRDDVLGEIYRYAERTEQDIHEVLIMLASAYLYENDIYVDQDSIRQATLLNLGAI